MGGTPSRNMGLTTFKYHSWPFCWLVNGADLITTSNIHSGRPSGEVSGSWFSWELQQMAPRKVIQNLRGRSYLEDGLPVDGSVANNHMVNESHKDWVVGPLPNGFFMAYNWGWSDHHFLTGMILQVLLQCHHPFPKDALTLRPQNAKKRMEKILKILVQPHILPYIFSIWESFSKNQTNAMCFCCGRTSLETLSPLGTTDQKQWSITLQGINVSHLGKGKIIFKRALVSFQECIRYQRTNLHAL